LFGVAGIAILGVLITVTAAVSTVFAAPSISAPPQPSIVSGPSAPTTARTASFTYKDSQANVSFKCSLDNATLTACASFGTTYGNLADGPHTFRVAAQLGRGPLSSPAARSWSVDTASPTIAIAFPANSRSYNALSWTSGCPAVGLCGTATDATGVQAIQVSIFQWSSLRFWNGTSFSSNTPVAKPATVTTPTWRYPMAVPADGLYTVSVWGTDSLGNSTATLRPLAVTFQVDTTPPPSPIITQQPENPTTSTNASVRFSDAEAGMSYQCKLDGGASLACNSGQANYTNLTVGDHCFQVLATDPAGNTSAAASTCWTVLISGTFSIKGNASQLFSPGLSQLIDLSVTNPFNFAMKVTSITVNVQPGTTKNSQPNAACSGTQNLIVSRPFSGTATVPANSTKTFTQLALPQTQWPVLQMPDLPINQDACKKTTFNIAYTGTATKA
jgi:hypothetical protein